LISADSPDSARAQFSRDFKATTVRFKRERAPHGAALPPPFSAMSSSDDESDHPVSEAEEAFQERQMAVVKRLNAVGCAFIRGVDEDVEPPYSEEDVAAAQNFAAGQEIDDDDCGIMMFDTSTGNAVVSGIADEVKKAVAKKSKSAKFDHLLALTYALNDNDMWARDNELWGDGDAMQSACEKLGAAWRKLLGSSSNPELGVDEEFTRPGTEALLEDFGKILEDAAADTGVDYGFNWKP
jgi:hypothetical protein